MSRGSTRDGVTPCPAHAPAVPTAFRLSTRQTGLLQHTPDVVVLLVSPFLAHTTQVPCVALLCSWPRAARRRRRPGCGRGRALATQRRRPHSPAAAELRGLASDGPLLTLRVRLHFGGAEEGKPQNGGQHLLGRIGSPSLPLPLATRLARAHPSPPSPPLSLMPAYKNNTVSATPPGTRPATSGSGSGRASASARAAWSPAPRPAAGTAGSPAPASARAWAGWAAPAPTPPARPLRPRHPATLYPSCLPT